MKSLLYLLALLFAVNFSYAQNSNPWPTSGNVGIGTTTPTRLLDVLSGTGVGPLRVQGPAGYLLIDNVGSGESYYQANSLHQFQGVSGTPIMTLKSGGNVGIGTTSPLAPLDIRLKTDQHIQFVPDLNGGYPGFSGIVCINDANSAYTPLGFWATNYYFGGGNVGIGTTTPDQKLTVNGTIHAKEVKVDLSVPAPDYVFEKSYKLKSLPEVAKYVALNKHLPEIPSAKVMKQNGVNVSELNMKLLQKVEELTLYLIEKDKKDKEQQGEINRLKEIQIANQIQQTQIDQLKQQLETLTKEIRKDQ